MTYIRLRDVEVFFKTLSASDLSLRRKILTGLGRRRLSDRTEVITALESVSLDVESGTRLALIGSNGAGKTTLLQVMAGSLPPRRGTVKTEGRVFSLLGGAGAGLDPNLTGLDNIVAMGVMLGESPKVMRARVDEIADFSELGDRLRNPVSSYSSGMNARLRFSVLMTVSPEILIMDEGISTADPLFAAKAAARLSEFRDQAEIIVMTSHGSRLTDVADTALWLERGRVRQYGPAADVQEAYLEWIKEQGGDTSPDAPDGVTRES